MTARNTTHGGAKRGAKHPLYGTWCNMLTRCRNPKYQQWKDYGGRGIEVCEGWSSLPNGFPTFVADMGERPGPKYTVHRIDNDGNYSCGHCAECLANRWPMNCRWATHSEQSRHRCRFSDEIMRAIQADPRPVRTIANEYGVNRSLIYRIKKRVI